MTTTYINGGDANEHTAIHVSHLTKNFKIPHEQVKSVRRAFVNLFNNNTYENFIALDNLSFSIQKGEFFGIVGKNGSGKSTILKILAQIYRPTSGKIIVNGKVAPFLELGIGFNPELSGRDNVFLNATILGLNEDDISSKFKDILSFSELEAYIDLPVKNYSSGMQVRLAFSVLIHIDREILLMDEVLAVGDEEFQRKCLQKMREFKNEGKTIILVSHDLQSIERFCDTVMVLSDGKISHIGHPTKALQNFRAILRSSTKGSQEDTINKSLDSANVYISRIRSSASALSTMDERLDVTLEITSRDYSGEIIPGISILDTTSGSTVCGTNSLLAQKLSTEKIFISPGSCINLTWRVPNFFASGEYAINLGLRDENMLELYIQYKVLTFIVSKNRQSDYVTNPQITLLQA